MSQLNNETELEQIINFLCGATALDGVYFGESPVGKPKFWWRKKLRQALANHDREVRLDELELMRNPNHAHSKSYYEKRKAELEGSNG